MLSVSPVATRTVDALLPSASTEAPPPMTASVLLVITLIENAPAPPTPVPPIPTPPAIAQVSVSSRAPTNTFPPADTLTSPLMAARVSVSRIKTVAEPAKPTTPEAAIPAETAITLVSAVARTSTSPFALMLPAYVSALACESDENPELLPIHALVPPSITGTVAAGAPAKVPLAAALNPTATSSSDLPALT